ncbi:MAG: hypothetical protein KUG77_13440, partial [Nannocystaceae bacterium]|nr:hypothetical protein [Nannocystaceae bacterium]
MERVQLLPEESEQAWLLEQTATLIEQAGWELYLTQVLLRPDAKHFPDRWTPDVFGVRRLARRLLLYAGLGSLGVSVELFEGDHEVQFDVGGRPSGSRHHGAAAWFAGIEDGVCIFGVEVDQLDDALSVTAAMAHETAHVFRRVRGLKVEDRDTEERLTDLTTVYLGFGLLTTNATSRHRSAGNFNLHQWSHQSLGYLPPQAMSYLLALWARVRDCSNRKITSVLESNQAGSFSAASKRIAARLEPTIEQLGLPSREDWPEPYVVEDLAVAIPDDLAAEEAQHRERLERLPEPRMNDGHPVFRVRRTRRLPFGVLGAATGAVLGGLMAGTLGDATAVGIAAACSLASVALGGSLRADHLSLIHI